MTPAGGTEGSRAGPGPGSEQVHLGSVVEQERRLLESPPCDNHKFECVVLAQDFLVA